MAATQTGTSLNMASPLTYTVHTTLGPAGGAESEATFQFPLGSTYTYKAGPKYDRSGRQLLASKIELSVTFLVGPKDAAGATDSPPETQVTTDRHLDEIIKILQTPRGVLRGNGLGLGRFQFAPAASWTGTQPLVLPPGGGSTDQQLETTFDVANGPMPQQPIEVVSASPQAKLVTWTVVIEVPPNKAFDPRSATASPTRVDNVEVLPESLSYSTSITNQSGAITRTIEGQAVYYQKLGEDLTQSIEVNVRAGNTDRVVTGLPHLELIFPQQDGYRRTWNRLTVAENRTELFFSFTDSEIQSDTPYEVGILEPNLTYTIGSTADTSAFQNWTCGLQGSLKVAPNYPKALGVFAVLRIYRDLVLRGLGRDSFSTLPSPDKKADDTDRPGGEQIIDDGFLIPVSQFSVVNNPSTSSKALHSRLLSLTMEENRYSRELSVRITWVLLGVDLRSILVASGFAQPGRTGATWENWSSSVKSSQRPLGFGNESGAGLDYRIDLTNAFSVENRIRPAGETGSQSGRSDLPEPRYATAFEPNETTDDSLRDRSGDEQFVAEGDTPTEGGQSSDGTVEVRTVPVEDNGEGYVQFKNTVEVRGSSGAKVYWEIDDDFDDEEVDAEILNRGDNPFIPRPQSRSTSRRQRSRRNRPDRYTAVLEGTAIRIGAQPKVPVLVSLGEAIAIPSKEKDADMIRISTQTTPNGLGTLDTYYVVGWRRVYTLDRPPVGKQIRTNLDIVSR